MPLDIEQCLDELARAHGPVVKWLERGLLWLDEEQVFRRDLSKAERNCERHLAALQDNRDVLHLTESRYPQFRQAFVEARAKIDMVGLRLQAFLKRIRAHKTVLPDPPLYVVDEAIEDLPIVVAAYEVFVQEQECSFAFFNMSPDFLDSALLHAELDAIEDGCEECEGLAEALEARVSVWRTEATGEQERLLRTCDGLIQRLRFAQASKRQAVAKLRETTGEVVVAAKLKKLADDIAEDASEGSPQRVH